MDEFKDILEEKELKDYIKKYKYFILIGVVIIILIITTVVCIKTNKTQTKKENIVLTKTSKKEISKKEEIKKLVNGFDKINKIGIKSINYNMYLSVIIRILIFSIICIIR